MSQPKYNTQSLRDGIAQAKRHIQSLEQAIAKERQTIRDYRSHIAHNEELEAANVVIDANDIRED